MMSESERIQESASSPLSPPLTATTAAAAAASSSTSTSTAAAAAAVDSFTGDENVATATAISIIDDFKPLSIDDYLEADLGDNHGDASFTGVWHSAKGLLQYLLSNLQEIHSAQYVLELGSGTGWLGISLARNLNHRCAAGATSDSSHDINNSTNSRRLLKKMVMTDATRTGAAAWLTMNMEMAVSNNLVDKECVQVVPMDWTSQTEIQAMISMYPWDFIIGSDLIYSEDGVQALAKCMASFLLQQPQQQYNNENNNENTNAMTLEDDYKQTNNNNSKPPQLIYAHTQGRMPDLDILWFQELKNQGLDYNILETHHLWEKRHTVIMEIKQSTACAP